MAKLFFMHELSSSQLMGSGINDVDYEYYIGNNPSNPAIITHEITDAEYDNLINGTNSIVIENNSIVMRDEVGHPTDDTLPNVTLMESFITPENPLNNFNGYKELLEHQKNTKPNHSQMSKINEALDHMNSLDTSALTDDIRKILLNANKYVAINLI